MKTAFLSALMLGAMTFAASAAPVKMTDAQMDGVTAGFSWAHANAGAFAVGIVAITDAHAWTFAVPFAAGAGASSFSLSAP